MQDIDFSKADMTIFDSSRMEAFVSENNPKYANRIVRIPLLMLSQFISPCFQVTLLARTDISPKHIYPLIKDHG